MDLMQLYIDDPQVELIAIEANINSLLDDLHYSVATEAAGSDGNKMAGIADDAKSAYDELKDGAKKKDKNLVQKAQAKLSAIADKFKDAISDITDTQAFEYAKKTAAVLAGITAAVVVLQTGRKAKNAFSENKSVLSRGKNWGETHVNENGRKFSTWTTNERDDDGNKIGKNEMINRCYKTSDILKSTVRHPFSSWPSMYDKGLKETAGFERKTVYNDGSSSTFKTKAFGEQKPMK